VSHTLLSTLFGLPVNANKRNAMQACNSDVSDDATDVTISDVIELP